MATLRARQAKAMLFDRVYLTKLRLRRLLNYCGVTLSECSFCDFTNWRLVFFNSLKTYILYRHAMPQAKLHLLYPCIADTLSKCEIYSSNSLSFTVRSFCRSLNPNIKPMEYNTVLPVGRSCTSTDGLSFNSF